MTLTLEVKMQELDFLLKTLKMKELQQLIDTTDIMLMLIKIMEEITLLISL